jgi:ABC-type polysaccharide/polyol phosphate export permease
MATAPDARPSWGTEWVELRPSTGFFRGLDLAEVWLYREVFRTLVVRDFKARYKQAVFGVAWAVVQPLAGVVLFTFVFSRLAGLPSEGLPYAVFVFAGLSVWNCFSSGVSGASLSLVSDPDLVTKIYFPRILAPAAALAPAVLDMLIALPVLAVTMAVYGVAPGPQILLTPAWVALLLLAMLGIGSLYAAVNVRYRDVGHAARFLLQLWMFITPVVYSASTVEGAARVALAVNPMTVVVDLARWCLVDTHAPTTIDAVSAGVLVLSVFVGVAYFQRTERRFADLI